MSGDDLKRCPETGKRCYVSRKQAKVRSKHVRNRIRVYKCPHCNHFHVTKERAKGSWP
jgi:uncharacterized protein YlaI